MSNAVVTDPGHKGQAVGDATEAPLEDLSFVNSAQMNRVLVINGDYALVDLLRKFLALEGFVVRSAYDYHSGLALAQDGEHELDVVLSGGSRLELLEAVRGSTKVPILLLSTTGETVDRILDLQSGADDYLAKPLESRELAARIHAIFRRTRKISQDDGEIEVGDVALSLSRRVVVRGETPVELTAVEFNVLECLLRNAGRVVTRETLAERALGRPLSAFDRSVDVHVHNLRKKISATADEPIKSIRGVGYMYVLPQDLE
jgi:two-component system response regulator CpxR